MKKSRFVFVLIGIAILAGVGIFVWTHRRISKPTIGPAVPATEPTVSEAKFRAELETIRRAEEALPASERLTAWEIDFHGEVWSVAPGRECLYYLLHLANSFPNAPGRQAALPAVSANHQGSDWRHVVVCIDLKTGQIRWSREINGLVHFAVDPDTDVLYLYRERIVALSPDSGAVIQEFDLPEQGRRIQGLIVKGTLVLPQAHSSDRIAPDARLLLYDLAGKTNKTVNAADYWLISPDESRRLVRKDTAWDCVHIPQGHTLWSATGTFDARWFPFWHAGDATFIQGTEQQRGVITAVDFSTGKPRWTATLGWGVYESSQHQLRGGSYPNRFTPLTAINKDLLALDGSGPSVFPRPGGWTTSRISSTRAQLPRNALSIRRTVDRVFFRMGPLLLAFQPASARDFGSRVSSNPESAWSARLGPR